jgi:hypothetical protein
VCSLSWFKSQFSFLEHYGRTRHRNRVSDIRLCNSSYGNSNNIISDISLPKSLIRLREVKFFSEKRKEDLDHYNKLNCQVFKPLLDYNKWVLYTIFGEHGYSNWTNFTLQYDMSQIRSADIFDSALSHIKQTIPAFESETNQIEKAVQGLNQKNE